MPTPVLNPKITAAGLALFPQPAQAGFSIQLTHVALGTAKYTPAVNGSGAATQTALQAEVARYLIASGTNPAPNQVQVGLTITDTDINGNSPNGLAIGEIGFYAGTTLFAVWSQPTDPLFVKSAAFDIPIAYTLDVSILPASSVTISVSASQDGLPAFILQHEAKVDPHPQYLTTPEGNALIATAVAALVNSSPAALDTLKELATSLGNDANFATTMTNALAGKERRFDNGTRMLFAQASAPVGWTQDTSDNANNRMLRVVNTATHTVGGSHSPILNNVVPVHTHGFTTGNVSADHTHAIGDPGHVHNQLTSGRDNGATGLDGTYPSGSANPIAMQASQYNTATGYTGIWTGGMSANHYHSGSTDNGSSSTNWTPRYIDMIVCSKNA